LHAIDPTLAHKRHRFPEGLDHRSDQEIAAELDEIRHRRLVPDGEGALTEHVEERLTRRDRFMLSRRHDEQLGRCRGVRTPEHRRRDELLTLFSMGSGKPLRFSHADCAHGDMDRTGRERDKDSIIAEHRLINGVIVGKYGDDDFTSRRVARRLGEMSAALEKRLGLRFGAIIDSELMSCRQQIGGHGASHASKPNEAKFHALTSACVLAVLFRFGRAISGWLPCNGVTRWRRLHCEKPRKRADSAAADR
jgi:hypothetical protein